MKKLTLLIVVSSFLAAPIFADEVLDCLIEPHLVIEVGSPAMGIVEKIPVKRGNILEKGQVIAELDKELEEVAVDLAEERANFLESQFKRLKNLQDKSMAALDTTEQAETEMRVAALELERRKIVLEKKSIRSPVKGVVMERLLSPGEYAFEQAPVMRVAQTDPLSVEVMVPTSLYGKIKKGMTAKVVPEAPIGGEFVASVDVIDKVLDAASSTFGVRLNLPNSDLAIPAGLKCEIRFQYDKPLAKEADNRTEDKKDAMAVESNIEKTNDNQVEVSVDKNRVSVKRKTNQSVAIESDSTY